MEDFIDIVGYEKLYKINKKGEVWSCCRKNIKKSQFNKITGYFYIQLNTKGNHKNFLIHRLIATHFIPNPNNFAEIDHINRIRTDNSINNLRWCDRSTQTINSIRTNNSTGYRNITERKCGTFKVEIKRNGIIIYNKTFNILTEAICERDRITNTILEIV
jgi:hypothetical protein